MPSLGASLIKLQLRLAKPILRFTGIEAARIAQDNVGKLGARALLDRVTFDDVPLPEFAVSFATPCGCETANTHAILYLHGGGYVAGTLDYAKGFGGLLAAEAHVNTLCVAYRLAPEHKFPAALDDAYEAYRFLLARGYAPEHIAFAGESAGGGLMFALLLRLKDEGLPLPACAVGISPWVDLTLSGRSYRNNAFRDPSLIRESIAYYVIVYAAGREDEPFVSPLLGDLTGLPPALLFAGADEILLSDAVSLCEKLVTCGGRAELVVERGMWHVYPLFGTKESRIAIAHIRAFIRKELGLPPLQEKESRAGRRAKAKDRRNSACAN